MMTNGIMVGIETGTRRIYTFPYPIENITNFSYLRLYPIKTRIPIKTGTSFRHNSHDKFICYSYLLYTK